MSQILDAIERGLEIMRESPLKYHNIQHVEDMLYELQLLSPEQNLRECVSVAAAFHDAVYVPGRHDNELKSAELFLSECKDLLTAEMKDKVYKVILSTDPTSKAPKKTPEEQLMHDLDFMMFRSTETLMEMSERIRWEYLEVSEEEYWKGRLAFLKSVGAQKALYLSPFFVKYNDAARAAISETIVAIEERLKRMEE